LRGRLDDAAKDSAVEIDAGESIRVPSSEIVASAFAVEDIDHSDELRGGV
jgi:hypothetical protein